MFFQRKVKRVRAAIASTNYTFVSNGFPRRLLRIDRRDTRRGEPWTGSTTDATTPLGVYSPRLRSVAVQFVEIRPGYTSSLKTMAFRLQLLVIAYPLRFFYLTRGTPALRQVPLADTCINTYTRTDTGRHIISRYHSLHLFAQRNSHSRTAIRGVILSSKDIVRFVEDRIQVVLV